MQNAPERMNDKGTCSPADTPLARGSSLPVRYELIDKDGNVCPTKFATSREAAYAATLLWPYQDHDPDRTGRGWDIQVVGS